MTWLRSTLGAGRLLADLAATAAAAVLRPAVRLLQLVDDAHDTDIDDPPNDPPTEDEPPAGYLVWWRPDTGEVVATAEVDATTRARLQPCTGTADCQADADHMVCCPAPSRRSDPE